VLVQSDFPAGWTGKAPTPDTPEDKANAAEFSACMGMSGDDAHSADVKGDEFGMGSPGTQASSQAVIIKGEASYRQDVAALKGNKLQPCLQTLLTKALTKVVGTAPTNIQVTPLIVPTFGDVTTGLRMSASLSVQGQNLTVVVDALLIGKNKAEVTGTFTNIGQPFDLALEKTLIDKLGAKTNAS
jgi:large exoprotein involved in heme utilization and adhesion